jgi:hypothetical protein
VSDLVGLNITEAYDKNTLAGSHCPEEVDATVYPIFFKCVLILNNDAFGTSMNGINMK